MDWLLLVIAALAALSGWGFSVLLLLEARRKLQDVLDGPMRTSDEGKGLKRAARRAIRLAAVLNIVSSFGIPGCIVGGLLMADLDIVEWKLIVPFVGFLLLWSTFWLTKPTSKPKAEDPSKQAKSAEQVPIP